MNGSFALDAETFVTSFTSKLFYAFFILHCSSTACSDTPSRVSSIFFNIVYQRELVIFFNQFFAQIFFNVLSLNVSLTVFERTFQRKILFQNILFHAELKAFFVNDMTTCQHTDIVMGNLIHTNRTFSNVAFHSFYLSIMFLPFLLFFHESLIFQLFLFLSLLV